MRQCSAASRDHRIESRDASGNARRQSCGEVAELVATAASDAGGPCVQNVSADLEHRLAPDLPLVEHLHRRFARAMTRLLRADARSTPLGARRHAADSFVELAKQRRHLDGGQRRFAPLVAGAVAGPLHRLLLGHRRQHAERHRYAGRGGRLHDARATAASAMYSKCIVSPLIRQPRQTMASYVAAFGQTLRGDRNLERAGHAHDREVVIGAPTPRRAASRAPFSSPSVISSLKRETTIAKRQPGVARPSQLLHNAHLTHVPALLALELRLPLFEERARPFAHVGGGRDEAEQRRLERLCALSNDISRPRLTASRMYRIAMGALCGELARPAPSPRSISSADGHHPVDQTDRERFVGLDLPSGQQEIERRLPLPTSRARRCVPA